jgi:cytochrome b involved in lipid metabolism
MTRDEFERLIREDGQKLVLLDDLVLDVSDFMKKHPGGRFAI